jgi:putative pyruvate formate lyase activating enzyme
MIGRAVDAGEFAEISLALQEQGAANINIVTGSHAAPALALGIMEAKARGLAIPVLWNSSGYEGAETLDILKGLVDVYLPDLKTLDPEVAAKFFNAPDYPEQAAEAVLKMVEYRKENMVRETLVSGVIIRHLVIPGFLENTRQVLRWFSENIISESRGAWFSLMTQYTPVREDRETAVPDRYVSKDEYDKIIAMLEEFGIEDGYCQALVTGSEWLPDFERQNPFSSALSVPVWHWRNGFIFYK